MKVSKKDIDKLNAILSVNIEKTDYESNVEKVLKDYRKRANIPFVVHSVENGVGLGKPYCPGFSNRPLLAKDHHRGYLSKPGPQGDEQAPSSCQSLQEPFPPRCVSQS